MVKTWELEEEMFSQNTVKQGITFHELQDIRLPWQTFILGYYMYIAEQLLMHTEHKYFKSLEIILAAAL